MYGVYVLSVRASDICVDVLIVEYIIPCVEYMVIAVCEEEVDLD